MSQTWGRLWGLGICPPPLEGGRETVSAIRSRVGLWGSQGRDENPACGYPGATDTSYAVPKRWVSSYLNDQLVSSMQLRKSGGASHVQLKVVAMVQEKHKDRVMTLRANVVLYASPLPSRGTPATVVSSEEWGLLHYRLQGHCGRIHTAPAQRNGFVNWTDTESSSVSFYCL